MSCSAENWSRSSNYHAFATPTDERVATWPVRIAAAVHHALERRRQRNALLELDNWRLNDIGVTRDQARDEGRKPWWR